MDTVMCAGYEMVGLVSLSTVLAPGLKIMLSDDLSALFETVELVQIPRP